MSAKKTSIKLISFIRKRGILMSGYSLGIILFIVLFSCETIDQKEERLAKQYCSSCHIFPEARLLPKAIWVKEVLPNMAFRMGLTDLMEGARYIPMPDLVTVAGTLPGSPMVSEEEWKSITRYFEKNAPDSLVIENTANPFDLKLFEAIKISDPDGTIPLITLLKVDSLNNRIILGNRAGKLSILDLQFKFYNSVQLASPPSHISIEGKELTISLMGIMDPNDRALGEISIVKADKNEKIILTDSIKRPVFFEQADLNRDGQEDLIVCAFGNYTGELAVYEKQNDSYIKHILSSLPGSRRTLTQDFNNDGLTDILTLFTQGDEQITLYTNTGSFKFKQKNLLRFPPVYGSTYFEIVDFNNDGRFDILYTNGDNSDYSQILKPYHGVRIFLQDESGKFNESWFYPMPGASKAVAIDFDLDGDLDICSFSFFPDYYNSPQKGFIFFENKDGKLEAQTTSAGADGRWIVMDIADLEGDGDQDILLGALDFNTKVPKTLFEKWEQEKTAVLVLKNLTK